MRELIRVLCEDIGERFAGTTGEHRAAAAIQDRFEQLGVPTRSQKVPFVGWKLLGEPTLVLASSPSKSLQTAPVIFSGPTESGGVTGKVVRWHQKSLIPGLYDLPLYALIDEHGDAVAQVVVADSERAIGLLNPDPRFRLPTVVVGGQDQHNLDHASQNQLAATVSIDCEAVPDATSFNVITSYRGAPENPHRLIVDAHYDTQLNTPGCYDNASGVGAMYALLERVVAESLQVNIDFVAVAGEEIGMYGSSFLADRIAEQGEISQILACICLDQVSGGEKFWIWASSDLAAAAEAAAQKAQIGELGNIEVSEPMPGCDMWPFYAHGVPSVLFMWWRLKHYHQPEDTMEHVEWPKVERTVDAAFDLICQNFAGGQLDD